MFERFAKIRWAVYDCLEGTTHLVEKLPFEIGSDESVDLRLSEAGLLERHCALGVVKGAGMSLVKLQTEAELVVNGTSVDAVEIAPDTDYMVQMGGCLLAVRGGKKINDWLSGLGGEDWFFCQPGATVAEGPITPPLLMAKTMSENLPPDTVVFPQGLASGFFLRQFQEAMGVRNRIRQAEVLADDLAALQDGGLISETDLAGSRGALTCPVCWLHFDVGDMMHVAVHDTLRGNPLLGEDDRLRFYASRFNDRGQAIDAMGLPCTEMACPHCRRILPNSFAKVPHHIFSIVGDQSAGKSYYLSVLVKMLPVSLYKNFEAVFQDADPAGNALLNEMKQTLFGAQKPEQALLVKTQLEGKMYERLPRQGRMVALPKPFIFSISSRRAPERQGALIFYDNAGEHFQPGRDSADSPGAQHVASAAGVLFMFDPYNNPEFRNSISTCGDPQLERPVLDQQDIILSEMSVRIKKLLNLAPADRIATPLALLCGKCDAWMPILGGNPFKNPIEKGWFNLDSVEHNSQIVRNLMLRLCPTVVANAEQLSAHVKFFPVSSFGCPPVKIGPGLYAPDPRHIDPFLVEVPPLWLLSRIMPELVPTVATPEPVPA